MKSMCLFLLCLLLMTLALVSCDFLPEKLRDLLPDGMKPGSVSTTTVVTTTTPPTTTTVPTVTRERPAINGLDLADYTVIEEEDTAAEVARLVSRIEETYGITLPTAAVADGPTIRLGRDDKLKLNLCEIRRIDGGITVYGRGVNAAYLSVNALLDGIASVAATPAKDLTVTEPLRCDVSAYLPEGTLDILTAGGTFNRRYKGDLDIAFLGGSLTQGKSGWTTPIVNLLQSKMPQAKINTLNAGIGATDSECGAIRLQKDVLEKMTPDILFIDYAVNDGGFTVESKAAIRKNGAYIESIIKQCRALPEPPIIILLFFPLGQRGTTANPGYIAWKNGADLKAEIATHYGIGTVDVWAHFEAMYQEELKENPGLSYDTFLERYYAPTDRTHPMANGYPIFGEAIVDAIVEDPEAYLVNKVMADSYLKDLEDVTDLSYTLLSPEDIQKNAEGSFTHITEGTTDTDAPDYIPALRISETQLSDGVLQVKDGNDFSITFRTSAKALRLYGINSQDGMKVEILADGESLGTVDTKAANTYLYLGGVFLPDDGQEHTVTIRPAADNCGSVFRFGYIALGE